MVVDESFNTSPSLSSSTPKEIFSVKPINDNSYISIASSISGFLNIGQNITFAGLEDNQIKILDEIECKLIM